MSYALNMHKVRRGLTKAEGARYNALEFLETVLHVTNLIGALPTYDYFEHRFQEHTLTLLSTPPEHDDRSSIDKAIALLNAFGDEATVGVGVSELARRTNLPKSTAFRILASLQANHAVERAGKKYRLGRMIQDLGNTGESNLHAQLRDVITPYLVRLYELTKQTVHLAVLQGTNVLYLNKLFGQNGVRSPSRIGGKAPAYCTAVGKVLLAYNPTNAEIAMQQSMEAWTINTLTDSDALEVELATIRSTNLGYDREEILPGLRCVAAPVFDASGRAVAALSVSGPRRTFVPEDHTPALRRVTFEAARIASMVSASHERKR